MAKILIAYYSKGGSVKKMAKFVEDGVKESGVDVVLKTVEDVAADELIQYDGFIFGSPTYYGQMAAQVKKLLDDSVILHGRLEGRIGGAFTSAGNIGGGNETTILSILQAFMIHGMVVQGTSKNDHYGPVAIGAPDKRAERQCVDLGKRIAKLVKKLCQ
ncbi:MAG: NAD(P)H-dependent oxidoreductase [Elusimicrobia bacterium]|nr:NAD(P)H-dependent oxidoreductase [Elusimicrobiota bacterium]